MSLALREGDHQRRAPRWGQPVRDPAATGGRSYPARHRRRRRRRHAGRRERPGRRRGVMIRVLSPSRGKAAESFGAHRFRRPGRGDGKPCRLDSGRGASSPVSGRWPPRRSDGGPQRRGRLAPYGQDARDRLQSPFLSIAFGTVRRRSREYSGEPGGHYDQQPASRGQAAGPGRQPGWRGMPPGFLRKPHDGPARAATLAEIEWRRR